MDDNTDREIKDIAAETHNLPVAAGQFSLDEETAIEAEGVIRYRARPHNKLAHLLRALAKMGLGLAVATGLLLLPYAAANPFANWKNPVIIFMLVCWIGKTLIDAFFFEGYQS